MSVTKTALSKLTFLSALIAISATTLLAQERTVKLGGESVTFQISDSEIFVQQSREYGPGGAPVEGALRNFGRELAMNVLAAQSQLIKDDTWITDARKKQIVSVERMSTFAGGVIVPRAYQIEPLQIQTLLNKDNGSVQPVLLYNDRRVLSTGTITLKFTDEVNEDFLKTVQDRFKLVELERPDYLSNGVRFSQTPDTDQDSFTIAEMLANHEDIEWAEPDLTFEIRKLGDPPNDPFFDKQWYLKSIKIEKAWEFQNASASIIVAVLDDGIDSDHPDLKVNILRDGENKIIGKDLFEFDDDPSPASTDAHGTACAGIIAAATDNGQGVSGISWHAKIMPIRISGPQNFASDDSIAKAINFARKNGAKILNCSWGGGPPSSKIIEAIDKAVNDGCLVVASAGNALPAQNVFFPARYEKCIAVGAIKRNDTLFGYSCHGPGEEVDLVAPSGDVNLQGDVFTLDHSGAKGYNVGGIGSEDISGNVTGKFGGTSAAAPVVSGCAALIWAVDQSKTGQEIRKILESTATKVDNEFGGWHEGRSKLYGMGKVNPVDAIMKLNGPLTGGHGVQEVENDKHSVSNETRHDLDHPIAFSYTVSKSNQEVELKPDSNNLTAVFVDRNAERNRLMKLSDKISNPSFYSDEKTAVYVVPRSSLNMIELDKAMKENVVTWVTPVFDSKLGGQVVPMPRLSIDSNNKEETMKLLAKWGLRVVDNSQQSRIEVGFDSGSSRVLINALNELRKEPSVRAVEPGISRTIKKF